MVHQSSAYCVLWQANKKASAETIPALAPAGPSKHPHIDYFNLLPRQGKWDVLMVVDKFSYYAAMHTTQSSVRDFFSHCCLLNAFILFSAQVMQDIMRMINVQWTHHCPYRPYSLGGELYEDLMALRQRDET